MKSAGRILVTATAFFTMSNLSVMAHAAETITYTYDAMGRLIKVENSGSANNTKKRYYCYDAAGNRTIVESETGTPANCTPVQG